MNRTELKAQLAPIVCDLNQTKNERSDKLGPIASEFMRDNPNILMDNVFNIWNEVMVEIVEENNLVVGRKGGLKRD